ncbi:LysR substrate-binding domain-containing protein [Xylophilus sp. GOD-11R]|uniref:LysR substrate-binding domain-containing protein n=1 Tax=Xylophilus sp. GOD-11R TaxID=3089814 RepID=UPI00298C7690|nr:LysR substrate-binding domain-containing protein [Xylophilus sp. GOD-11R]WPB57321.1 LysR substrate-binding domain-containing protein [Xylophilus sp. GOD-11R]
MRSALPPLALLIAFEAAARRLNFSLAAAELHLTPSAVSHQIAKLEQYIGVKLFERRSPGLALTAAGARYLQRIAGALQALRSATDDVRQGIRSTLHVHASPSFANLWLMPRLSAFAQRHPNIALSLSASPSHSDFAVGGVDLDIRYGTPQWPQLQVMPIADETILPLAHPDFIARQGIAGPADLLQVPLIQSTVSVVQWSDWFASRHVAGRPERYAYRFDRAYLALDAAEQGLGVALESTFIGQRHLAGGRLQPVFDDGEGLPVRGHFLVCPQWHLHKQEVARFVAWVQEEVAAGSHAPAPAPAVPAPADDAAATTVAAG